MKVLFWVCSGLSIVVGLMIGLLSWVAVGLGLIYTPAGEVVCEVGKFAGVAGIIGALVGFFVLCKGREKLALLFALLGLFYSGGILAGMVMDDLWASTTRDREFDRYMEEIYGEGWDSPPAIDGISELYQILLNQFYVAVREEWPAEKLMELGACSMSGYYGDAPLDNIGFVFMDLNGDAIQELVIGTASPAEETVIFCIYANDKCPNYAIDSVEGQTYCLHDGEGEGTYEVEIIGCDYAWVIGPVIPGGLFDATERAGAMDPAGRLTLGMIPFSWYK